MATTETPRRTRAADAVVAALLAALIAAATSALVVSFLSYAQVKRRLDAFASDHDAAFGHHRFELLRWELRALAAVLAVAAAVLFVHRRRLASLVGDVGDSIARAARHAAGRGWHTMRTESAPHLGALVGILLVAVLVRLDFLFQPMRYDESGTYVHYASRPLYIGISAYTAPNNHIFHTLLVHITTAVFGPSPWAIRLPAFGAGVLLVPATYLATRRFYGRSAALLAAALVASSSELVEYSTNARGYTLLALDFMLMLAVASSIVRSSEPAGWIAFAVLSAFGMWTVPTMLYGVAIVAAWLSVTMLAERRLDLLASRLAPSLAGAAALTVVLYAPAIVSSGPHALLQNDFVRPRSLRSTAEELPHSLWRTATLWNRDLPVAVAILLALAFAVALLWHRRVSTFGIAPALAAVVALPIVVVQRVVPYERVWLLLLPLYLATASAGAMHVARSVRERRHSDAVVAAAALAAALALGVAGVSSRSVYHSEDTSTFRPADGIVRFLEPRIGPGTRILAAPPADLILEYYLDERGLDGGRLLYSNFRARHLFVVVKQGEHEYPLARVLEWRPGSHPAGERAVLRRRFAGALVYELLPRT